ncbi:hypothetical protein LZG75_09830 [Polynucleobacter sp. IMCC30063]|uniref:hypothetical protein n=1 Tax=Polynucleobacter sp. IMCC30063 TaxID=2907298 RepID=UPI001F1CC91C|nr:hypothetical protein [Polynucleobacter sp. IMCC30063]MCE7506534.1 hypothetical protein [Polynucleobacter sp. IMCC30063]
MSASVTIKEIQSAEDAARKAVSSSMISPRFYTTDHDYMNKINIEPVRAEWDMMMKEYEGDNNQDHFQRDEKFNQEVQDLLPKLRVSHILCKRGSFTTEGFSPHT